MASDICTTFTLSLSLFSCVEFLLLQCFGRIEAIIDSLNASGCSHGDTPPPVLVSTNVETTQHDPLLSLTFELNPLTPKEEVKVDQRILLDVLPVQVVYDAVSSAIPAVLLCCCAAIVLSLSCC